MKYSPGRRAAWLWILAVGLAPSLAQAHAVAGETSGLAHGMAHLVGGLDHFCAVVAVGGVLAGLCWAGLCGGPGSRG